MHKRELTLSPAKEIGVEVYLMLLEVKILIISAHNHAILLMWIHTSLYVTIMWYLNEKHPYLMWSKQWLHDYELVLCAHSVWHLPGVYMTIMLTVDT